MIRRDRSVTDANFVYKEMGIIKQHANSAEIERIGTQPSNVRRPPRGPHRQLSPVSRGQQKLVETQHARGQRMSTYVWVLEEPEVSSIQVLAADGRRNQIVPSA